MQELDRSEVVSNIRKLRLPNRQYAVFGSAVLTMYNIRSARDIDIIVLPSLYTVLKTNGWTEMKWENNDSYLQKGIFEVFTGWNSPHYSPNGKKIIEDAQMIDEIPVTRLSEILTWKKTNRREKDKQDVLLVENYLAKR